MTSEGSSRVVPSYGVVSSAKAALESHVRQLAMELARLDTGVTANAIRAGVTVTPALMKIPEHDAIIEAATRRNPTGRMTTPQDVADAIVALSRGGRVHQRRGHRRRRRRVRHGVLARWPAASWSSGRSTSTSSSARSGCRRPARPSWAARSAGSTAARAATRPWRRRASAPRCSSSAALGDDEFGTGCARGARRRRRGHGRAR